MTNTPFGSLSSEFPQLLSRPLSQQGNTVIVVVLPFVSEVMRAGFGVVHPCIPRM